MQGSKYFKTGTCPTSHLRNDNGSDSDALMIQKMILVLMIFLLVNDSASDDDLEHN